MTKSIKIDLQVFWDTIDPGNIVTHSSPAIKVIRELGLPEVRVRNNDNTKFDTKAERNTSLWQYAQSRQSANSNISSANSNISNATSKNIQARKISKPQPQITRGRSTPTPNNSVNSRSQTTKHRKTPLIAIIIQEEYTQPTTNVGRKLRTPKS